MLKLPKYLLSYNREDLPAPVICCTAPPLIVGQVWTFKDDLEFVTFVNNYNGLGLATISGYKIAITFGGVFSGTKMPVTPKTVDDIKKTLLEMAEFYKREKIDDKPGYYKKFQLVPDEL
jgi:hypothetical protein